MFFDWSKEIKEPLNLKTLRKIKFKELLRISFISLLALLITFFSAFWLSNHGVNFDNLHPEELLIALFGTVAFLVFLFCLHLINDTLDMFELLSADDNKGLRKYQKLLLSGCPEVENFDKAIRALKRFPTKGELSALEIAISECLREKVQEAFLKRDWNTLNNVLRTGNRIRES